ncbi:MAG: DUF6868 family protein [Thermodesulfobacteriota bacterium]
MTIDAVRGILGWSMVINYAILLWWFLVFTLAHDWMHRFHGRWFRLSVEAFDGLHYGAMAVFKIGIMLLNLTPWLALQIVG